MTPGYILKRTFTKVNLLNYPNKLGGVLSRKPDYHKTSISTSPSPITMTPCYILKRTFTKVNLLNYPNNLGGCYLANRITTKLRLHFHLPHYNDTVLNSKTNFYKSQPPPQLPQQFGGGGAISQTGLPQNSISTSPSPITMTPCYILKRTFTKAQQFNWGGAISQTGLPQNSISTSPSPITMTPCYILKRTFTKVNLLNYPNNGGGGCYLANRITTKLHLHFPLPHYNDTGLYSKTNFYKSQPPQLPQQIGGGVAISQTGLPQNLHLHFPLPHNNDTVLYSKTNFYKSQPPQLPQQFGGVLSRKPDYHKTPSPLPPPPLQ